MPFARSENKEKDFSKHSVSRRRHAARRVKHHYDRHMPDKKHHRVLVWVFFLTIVSVVAAQLLYPLDRALPLARIHNERVGFADEATLAQRLNSEFMKSEIVIENEKGKPQRFTIPSAGAEPQTDAMIKELSDYGFWPRLIPFSIFVHHPQLTELTAEYNQPVLTRFTRPLATKLSTPAVNAGLAIKDSQVVATRDEPGRVVKFQELATQIEAATIEIGSTTKITPVYTSRPAETTAADFEDVKAQAEAALARPLLLNSGETTVDPSAKTRATWLELSKDSEGAVNVTINQTELNKYFASLNKKVGSPSAQTNISLVDGRRTEKDKGKVGKAVDEQLLTQLISQWVLRGEGAATISIPLKDVPPKIIYDNKYTSSQKGLQAYVKDAARYQNANIVIQQIDGKKWRASDSATLSIPSASTYKLFVALDLFDRMNKGQVAWGDAFLDTDVSTCFDRMTIASTNPCSVEWLRQWGRTSVNDFIYSKGFSRGTNFNDPQAVKTTAADLAKYMVGFENGSLIRGAQRERLLHSLSVHPYRYGIPTGSKGQVWDKVGFLWDYIHDAAIVYHPKGKYVMVVMTKGRSYGTIAQITRDVERIMYP